jgi:hypothetical protein
LTADFSVWDRKTLEQFARDAADENAALKADLKLLLAAWRQSLKGQDHEQDRTIFCTPAIRRAE